MSLETLHVLDTCIHVCMHVRIYVCMYACMYVFMYACIHACVYARMYVCMYVCLYVCMYVCMYTRFWYNIDIYLRASPPAAGPLSTGNCWQVDCWNGSLIHLKLSFWKPSGFFLGTWDTILVILGSRGTPNGHTEAQLSVFINFRVDLGSLLGFTLGTILWFSMTWGGRMGDSFQVHVFGDQGGCMCYNHNKTNVFCMVSLFLLTHWFGVLREGFGSHFDIFGDPGGTFSDFLRSWR